VALRKSWIALLVILIETVVIGGLALQVFSAHQGFYTQDEVTFRISEKREIGVYLKGHGLKFVYGFFTDEHGLVEVPLEDYQKYNVGDLYTWTP